MTNPSIIDLFIPFADMTPESSNDIIGGTIRALETYFIPSGVKALLDMARVSNYLYVDRIPWALHQLDTCLSKVIESACPEAAKEELSAYMAAHNGIETRSPFGVQKLGCVYEAMGMRVLKSNDKAIAACSISIANKESIREWRMGLLHANSVMADLRASVMSCDLTSRDLAEQINNQGRNVRFLQERH